MLIRVRKDAEDGVVLVTVLLLTMIMLIIVAGTMAYAVGSQNVSRRDQDWNAALAAAEAGLDDYLFRLNENDQYYLYNATTAPPDGNQAFTTWVSVPDSGATSVTCTASANSNIPCFRYKVDTTNLVAQGAIIITATGRSRGVTRTIQATLRRKAFIDYLYFTDYETKDPAAYDSRRRLHARGGPDVLRQALLRGPGHRGPRRLRGRHRRELLHRDLVRDAWTPSTGRCTRTTPSGSAATRRSTATSRRAGTRPPGTSGSTAAGAAGRRRSSAGPATPSTPIR